MTHSENSNKADGLHQISQLQQRAVEFAESGMMEEALEAAMICIGLQEEVAPENMLLRAKLIQNASRILMYSGDVDQAEAIANEGIGLLQSLPEATADEIAHALLNLSSILYAKRDLDNATGVLLDAMNIWKEEKGAESAEVADCLNNLGRLFEEKGDLDEAINLHQQAIDIKVKVFGDHDQTAFSYMNKGLSLMVAKRFAEAETALVDAVECCKRIGKAESEICKASEENLRICREQM